MNDSHKLLRRKAAAEYIGVSTTTLDRLTSRGCIAYISVPSSGKAGKPSALGLWVTSITSLTLAVESAKPTNLPQLGYATANMEK